MHRLLAKISTYWSVFVIGSFPFTASAQLDEAATRLDQAGRGLPGGGEGEQLTIAQFVGRIIDVAIGLLGIIFLIEVVYAGFLYLTAGGETDKVEKAKDLLRQGVIGIILILLAFVISNFVIDALDYATTTGGGGGSGSGGSTP